MPYPFEEVLEYPHQFRQAKEEAGKDVGYTSRDMRRIRRRLRKNKQPDTFIPIEKYGKWIGEQFSSSRRFRQAYAYVRSEHEFYSRSYY